MNYDSLIAQYSEVDDREPISVEGQLELMGYYLKEKHWAYDYDDDGNVAMIFSADIADLLINFTLTSDKYNTLGIEVIGLIRDLFWEGINKNIDNKHAEFIANRNREIDKQKSVIPPPQMSFGNPDYDKIGKYVCDVLKEMKIIK